MLAGTDAVGRVTVATAGANAVRMRGAVSPDVTLTLAPDTDLPTRLTWQQRMIVREPGSILRVGPASIGPGRLPADAPEETVTLTFADHRDVVGFVLPLG